MKTGTLAKLLAIVVIAGFSIQTQADEFRFTAAVDSAWTNGLNWDNYTNPGNGVPGPNDSARFQGNKACDLDTTAVILNLNQRGNSAEGKSVVNILSGATLTANATDSGSVGGDNRVGAGAGLSTTLNIYSNALVTLSGVGQFEMGADAAATGTVNIAAGGSLVVNQLSLWGRRTGGVAYVNVNGGTATFTDDVQVGNAAGSFAYVTLNSGTLISDGNFRITDNVSATAELLINGGLLIATNGSVQIRDGAGVITQTDGVIYSDDLYVGHLPGSTGTMNMSGGSNTITGWLTVGNQEKDGNTATGTLNMSGGWMFANVLSIAAETNTTGTLNLSGADTLLKTEHLRLGDSVSNGQVNASSTINATDGLFQIHDITADANSANESFVLSGAVLKLRHLSTSNILEKMEALIDGGVLTWSKGALGSTASTFDPADADFTWVNGSGTLLYADTNGTHYTYMWAETDQPYPTFADWAADYNLGSGENAYGNNPDGDSMNNLMEYGLGGNPTNANDVGILPATKVVEGVTDYFYYIYNRRTDAVERSLFYDVLNNTTLVGGTWANDYQLEIGVSAPFTDTLGDEFEAVTNRISMTGKTEDFTKLEVTINE